LEWQCKHKIHCTNWREVTSRVVQHRIFLLIHARPSCSPSRWTAGCEALTLPTLCRYPLCQLARRGKRHAFLLPIWPFRQPWDPLRWRLVRSFSPAAFRRPSAMEVGTGAGKEGPGSAGLLSVARRHRELSALGLGRGSGSHGHASPAWAPAGGAFTGSRATQPAWFPVHWAGGGTLVVGGRSLGGWSLHLCVPPSQLAVSAVLPTWSWRRGAQTATRGGGAVTCASSEEGLTWRLVTTAHRLRRVAKSLVAA